MSLTMVDQAWIFHYITQKGIGLSINTLRHLIPTSTFPFFNGTSAGHQHIPLVTAGSVKKLRASALPWIRQNGGVASLPSPRHWRPEAPPSPHHEETFTQCWEHWKSLGVKINDFRTVVNSLVFMGSLNVTLSGIRLNCYLWSKKKKKKQLSKPAFTKTKQTRILTLEDWIIYSNSSLPCDKIVHLHPFPLQAGTVPTQDNGTVGEVLYPPMSTLFTMGLANGMQWEWRECRLYVCFYGLAYLIALLWSP